MTYILNLDPALSKNNIIEWVEHNRGEIIGFLQGFLRVPSPNPPGDTRDAAAYTKRFLDERNIEYKIVGPDLEKPNIVSSFTASSPGRSLILNGHIDVFPVGDGKNWSCDPWGGELVDNKIWEKRL